MKRLVVLGETFQVRRFGMWVLVVGKDVEREREGRAMPVLAQLGCRTQGADFRDPFDDVSLVENPPSAVLVEALDEVDAARAAHQRLQQISGLSRVPTVCAVSVRGLSRLRERESFDDFVLHPYVPAELVLRLRTVDWNRAGFSRPDQIKLGRLLIDGGAHEVRLSGRVVPMTAREFALLRFLAERPERVFTRDQLLQQVWGVEHYGGSRTVDIHIRRLRAKLGGEAVRLKTVRGVGYKFVGP